MSAHLRRAQLIAPFGPGAIHILKGGFAVVTGGLDYWFANITAEQLATVKITDMERLSRRIGVSHFRLPPGPECSLQGDDLAIPLFRFPTWFLCPRCNRMEKHTLNTDGILYCQEQRCRKEPMRQVSFAAVCDHGHLQDFPWREWVHRQREPSCAGSLVYKAGGSGSLDDIRIRCSCGKERSLAGVMSGRFDDPGNTDPAKRKGTSALSLRLLAKKDNVEDYEQSQLNNHEHFLCQGGKVWLGIATGDSCTRPLRCVLINATNVHYADVASALWLPVKCETEAEELRKKMDAPKVRSVIRLADSLGDDTEAIVGRLKRKFPDLFSAAQQNNLEMAVKAHHGDTTMPSEQLGDDLPGELGIRWPEYSHFESNNLEGDVSGRLVVRGANVDLLTGYAKGRVSALSLVDRLMETRVFTGFSRLLSTAPEGAPPKQLLLWKGLPAVDKDRWLPAVQVFGEGIFIRFNEEMLTKWEAQKPVLARIRPLQKKCTEVARRMHKKEMTVTPRLVMIHSLAHLLIRRLVFSCGYGSASLRERLYVSSEDPHRMAGLLIYTAAGDCEGSMGGLVRMGEPSNLSKVFDAAIADAAWCSGDPVCRESGEQGGQGTDGLNIAACHSCALLPETSCEMFNQFLDRLLVTSYFT
jgi:hypothetical protein